MSGAIKSVTNTLFGGSSSSGSSSQASSSQLDPRLFNLFNQNYQSAKGVANNLDPREIAGFTPTYYEGANALRDAVYGPGQDTLGTGVSYAANAGAYSPQNVSGGSFLNANIDAYMNPYLQSVAGNTISDMYRARQMQGLSDNDAAVRAGAFGGSRHGVVESETNRNFYDRLGSTLSNIYAGGFNSAAGLAGQDLSRDLQADIYNQQAGLTANQQQLSAADSLAKLGTLQQSMGMEGANALMNLGLGEQQLTQAQLDSIRNLPLEQQAILNEALGINPAGGSGMTSKSTGTASNSGSASNGMFSSLPQLIGTAMFLSDKRAKENVDQIGGALDKVKQLSGYEYNYLGDNTPTAGVMAQEVERVSPNSVFTAKNGMKAVNYPEVTGLLVEAVKELATKRKRG